MYFIYINQLFLYYLHKLLGLCTRMYIKTHTIPARRQLGALINIKYAFKYIFLDFFSSYIYILNAIRRQVNEQIILLIK